jgi:acetolactate synthase-1/2/3 large subunit
MKASDYIVAFLERKSVTAVFELSGGMIAHLLDSFGKFKKIQVVSMHHEQGAAFAADAYGRMTGVPGVALATSGPGATNLLTGMGGCYFDSSPAVFITGQVNRHEQKGDRPIRQLGFQETDIVSMATPITKAAWKLQTPEEIPRMFEAAFALATSARPGPVLLDVPMDLQRSEISPDPVSETGPPPVSVAPDESFWNRLGEQMRRSQRPLILVGGGVRAGQATELLRDFATQAGVPVVHSLMAVDVLPYAHPLRMGMIGSYGNRWANWAIGTSDFLLVLGSRLDVRQTGSETESFKGGRVIFHVDCDAGEINNRISGCEAAVCQLKDFLAAGIKKLPEFKLPPRSDWLAQIAAQRREWPDVREVTTAAGSLNPNELMHSISQTASAACAFVVDVGQHQMWAAQSLELTGRQRFLTSGGMGSMGFALPAAVGVAFACPKEPVVVIAGDGAFQCNIQELQTVKRNQLPLKIVVINNHCHGMVRQFQESYFDSRYQSTLWGYSAPSFVKVAEAYGIPGRRITNPSEVAEALRWLWADPVAPMLLEVDIASTANVYPKMAFGRPITEMEPFFKSKEMEGT